MDARRTDPCTALDSLDLTDKTDPTDSTDPSYPAREAAPALNRRSFSAAAAALSAAALLSGCRSKTEPARDATLLHNRAVREAVTELQETMSTIDERLNQFNAENWQDALANLQTSAIRMNNSIDELRRALGYAEPA